MPYYQDAQVTLYHGDVIEVLPQLGPVDAVLADPPYGETSLEWDRWPEGWPALVAGLSKQMWCFGSLRMFFEHRDDFMPWMLGQDVVWEKHNGSNSRADRFRRVHELGVQFFQGHWRDLYLNPQYTHDSVARRIVRRSNPKHWGTIGAKEFVSEEGGKRLMRSVIYARGCHGHAVNETQKPESLVAPLIEYSVPPGGTLLSPFAGSGTDLVVARRLGKRAIGIEKRLSQCEGIVKRLCQSEVVLSGAVA